MAELTSILSLVNEMHCSKKCWPDILLLLLCHEVTLPASPKIRNANLILGPRSGMEPITLVNNASSSIIKLHYQSSLVSVGVTVHEDHKGHVRGGAVRLTA